MSEEKKGMPFDLAGYANKVTKGNKIAGIIIAIAMIVLGILMFMRPILTSAVLEKIAVGGFLAYGVYQVIMYFKAPAAAKNGWTLASGIMWLAIGLLMLFANAAVTIETFAFIFAFIAMSTGITRISVANDVKKAGGPSGWILASGIINLILAVFFLITPFAVTGLLGLIAGIYLVIAGIVLLADSASSKPIA